MVYSAPRFSILLICLTRSHIGFHVIPLVRLTISSVRRLVLIPTILTDVIKSRIQLRPTPPTSRPWTYINEELRAVVSEGGL